MNTQRPRGRRPKPYSQAERLARMMRILASREATIRELAQEFEVTTRQVRRDFDEIARQGHPVEHSKDRGERTWWLPLGYKGLPQIMLSPIELMSLYLAKSHLAYLRGTPFLDDVESVIAKVEAGLPARTVNHLERIIQAFAPQQRPIRDYSKQRGVLLGLRKALLLQLSVILSYKKPDADNATSYRFDPYCLALYKHGLYVVGYSHRAREQRTFAVERIQRVEVMDQRFDLPASYSPSERTTRLFGVMEGPQQEVRIQFSPDVAYMFKERQWHPSQMVKKSKHGSVVLTMKAGGMDEIASWVLSWGDKAKVLAPVALRKIVTAELRAASMQYQPSSRQ